MFYSVGEVNAGAEQEAEATGGTLRLHAAVAPFAEWRGWLGHLRVASARSICGGLVLKKLQKEIQSICLDSLRS